MSHSLLLARRAALMATALLLAACTPSAAPVSTSGATTAPSTNASARPTAESPSPQEAAASAPAARVGETKPASEPSAVADFYAGKTVRIVVGFAAGGGFDAYARLIARYFGKHIPGNPQVIVENMPGAGSLIAANHVYNQAAKDGTELGHFNGSQFMQYLFGAKGTEFEPENFAFLGVPAVDHQLCVANADTGFKSLKDAQNPGGRQVVLGGMAPGSNPDDMAAVLTGALDLNIKLVPGYSGTSTIRLAMEQGEVDGMCGWSWEGIKISSFEDVASGKMVLLVAGTEKPIAGLPVASPPLARDLARTDEGRELIAYGIEKPNSLNRIFALPPDVPAERVSAMRQAFLDTLKDPALLAEAERSRLDIQPLTGEEVEKLVKETQAMPDGIKDKLKKLLVP